MRRRRHRQVQGIVNSFEPRGTRFRRRGDVRSGGDASEAMGCIRGIGGKLETLGIRWRRKGRSGGEWDALEVQGTRWGCRGEANGTRLRHP